jgi:hypothetical protein
MKETSPLFDHSIGNVYDIREAPSYSLRQAAERKSSAAEAQAERDRQAQYEQTARRMATRRRMAEHGLTVIAGSKHF